MKGVIDLGLKPYPAYQDSGVEWLEQVPAHWEVGRLASFGRLFKGQGGSKGDNVDGGVPCVRYGDMYTTHDGFIHKAHSFIPKAFTPRYTPIKYGDILFAASGETVEDIGASAVNLITSEAYCAGDVIVFRPTRAVEAEFMGYVVGCRPIAIQKSTMGRGFTIIHIYPRQLKHLVLAIPPLDEQQAISRFLDVFDERVRGLVEVKEKLVGLLAELKASTVSEAVSGRIDVRTGQPYPAYRPSGIEWLGNIPAHWEAVPNRWIFDEVVERDHPDEELLSVTIREGVMQQTTLLSEKSKRKSSANVDRTAYKLVLAGDIVYNKMRAWQGATGVSGFRGIVSPAYVVQRPRSEGLAAYFHYLLRTSAFAKEAERWSYGIASDMWSLRPIHFKMIYCPRPPMQEQIAIAEYLDRADTKITTAISNTRREIVLLQEYRTRMIADVVTGKVDVREAADGLEETAV